MAHDVSSLILYKTGYKHLNHTQGHLRRSRGTRVNPAPLNQLSFTLSGLENQTVCKLDLMASYCNFRNGFRCQVIFLLMIYFNRMHEFNAALIKLGHFILPNATICIRR